MKINLSRPLAFFDLETTGLSISNDRIIEISIMKVFPEGNTESLTHRLNPGIQISEEAESIHGISNLDVKDEPSFKDLAGSFVTFLDNCDLAGYNLIKFDIPLLVEEFLRVEVDFDLSGRSIIDVQNIFHKMEPRTLKGAYKFYCNKELENAHSAEADNIATFEVFKSQLDKYENIEVTNADGLKSVPVINDVKKLSEFSYFKKNADLVGHIVFNKENIEVFNFGKHKGKTVEEVFTKEPSYYAWMMKSEFPLSTKKVITAIKLRGFNKSSVNIR
ncbi:MAG: 3'-5' exonuclease [Bacteroidales bacterium]|nr:3'-5' exonuclease [Bacteroidales bacterium]